MRDIGSVLMVYGWKSRLSKKSILFLFFFTSSFGLDTDSEIKSRRGLVLKLSVSYKENSLMKKRSSLMVLHGVPWTQDAEPLME